MKQLIISTYLEEPMNGCTKSFIDSVASEVAFMRVAGIENVEYVKINYPHIKILGLVKDFGVPNYITPFEDYYKFLIDVGADYVAVDYRYPELVEWVYKYKDTVWTDISCMHEFISAMLYGFSGISTTFVKDQGFFVNSIKNFKFKGFINIEGGVKTKEDVDYYNSLGYYVTIGKIVNDPKTIVKYFKNGG